MLFLLTMVGAASLAPAAQGPADPDPVVCKRDKTSEVGTHLRPPKVCMKKSEWDLIAKNTQNELQRLSDRAAVNPGAQPSGPKPH
jgi:hypothetical protein